jgi:hypothetical protein
LEDDRDRREGGGGSGYLVRIVSRLERSLGLIITVSYDMKGRVDEGRSFEDVSEMETRETNISTQSDQQKSIISMDHES